jgi:hypothetical protein
MGWLRDHHFSVSLGTFLVFASLLTLVLGYVGIILASAWFTGSIGGIPSELALYLPIIAILLIATVGSGVSLGWAVLRHLSRSSFPRSERLHSATERMEQSNSILNSLSLSDFVAPERSDEDEDALSALKQKYVEGEINEDEFEREIDRLTATESMDDTLTSPDNTRASRVHESRDTDREW